MKKIVICDGNNIGFMAMGIVPLTYENKRIEVIYVGLNMFRSYLREFKPDKFYLVWDGGRDAERMAIYPDYKRRKRELSPEEMKERSSFFEQLRGLQESAEFLGIIQYKLKGREADDIIFNLLGEGKESIIVSTDKDFYQLLERDGVSIYNPVKKQIIKREDVEKKYEIPISYFVDHKALTGDPSDNLPGIKGIGEKWAAWLINNVFDKAVGYDKMTKSQIRMVNLLFDGIDTFDLMRKLIRLKKIGKEEMEKGRSEDKPATIAELQERGIALCQQYGFEKHQNNFVNFIQPFEMLYRRQGK